MNDTTEHSIKHYKSLIADNQLYLPYFRNGFSNHYPMVLWSIRQMGGSDQDLSFQASDERWDKTLGRYRISFQKPSPAKVVINDQNWREHLGKRRTYPGFLDYFGGMDFKRQPDLLKTVLKELSARPDTVLFHALIRFSMGVQSSDLREQQIALAYWAANYRSSDRTLPPLADDEALETTMKRVMHFFAETVNFVALHVVTGYAALIGLPDELREILELPYAHAALRYAQSWNPEGEPLKNEPFDQALYREGCTQAFASLDDHYIKIIYALKQISELNPLPGLNDALRSVMMAPAQ